MEWETKRQTVEPHIIHLMCSYNYYLQFLCNWWQFIATNCLPSLLVFTSLLRITFVALQKPCQGNFVKFQGSRKFRLSGFEKDHYFLRIPKSQHKLIRNYKRGKLVSYFLNNAAETLYGANISENTKVGHVFQSKALFHLTSNLHKRCFSVFNPRAFTGQRVWEF